MENFKQQDRSFTTRVWIVDDEPISRFIIKKCIPDIHEFNVVGEFEDGKDAIETLEHLSSEDEQFPDVIILDVNMPIMDGWDFMSRFEEHFQNKDHPKVFILSSSEHQDDLDQCKKFSAIQEYLVKPTSIDLMEETLARHFDLAKKVV